MMLEGVSTARRWVRTCQEVQRDRSVALAESGPMALIRQSPVGRNGGLDSGAWARYGLLAHAEVVYLVIRVAPPRVDGGRSLSQGKRNACRKVAPCSAAPFVEQKVFR